MSVVYKNIHTQCTGTDDVLDETLVGTVFVINQKIASGRFYAFISVRQNSCGLWVVCLWKKVHVCECYHCFVLIFRRRVSYWLIISHCRRSWRNRVVTDTSRRCVCVCVFCVVQWYCIHVGYCLFVF